MIRSIRLFSCVLVVFFLASVTIAAGPPGSAGAKVFDPVWYRSERLGFRLVTFEASGRLEVSDEAIAFLSRKRTFRIPWAQVTSVEMGRLGQDQGNDWVIVRFTRKDGSRGLAGFTDARKLGWGHRTGEIFNFVRKMFRAAQPLPRLLGPVVRKVETATAVTPGLGPLIARLPEELEGAEERLGRYARQHPDDAEAWMMLARVSFLVRASMPAPCTPEEPPGRTDPDLAPCREALEHAMRSAPNDPRLLCGAARLLGTPYAVREDSGSRYHALDPAAALQFARQSAESDPSPGGCRRTLALLLALAGRPEEALENLDPVPPGAGNLRAMIENQAAFPLPEGAVPLPRRSRRLAVERFREGRVTELPTLRIRAFLVPAGASEVEAFYRARWEKFRWLAPTSRRREEGRVQFLRPVSGKTRWAPVRRASMIPPVPSSGVALELQEEPHADAEIRAAAGGKEGPRSILVVVDFTTIIGTRSR